MIAKIKAKIQNEIIVTASLEQIGWGDKSNGGAIKFITLCY